MKNNSISKVDTDTKDLTTEILGKTVTDIDNLTIAINRCQNLMNKMMDKYGEWLESSYLLMQEEA